MRTVPLVILFACALFAAALAHGQTPVAVPIGTSALTHTRGGAIEGCGVRLTGGQAAPSGASRWFDVSFNVFRRGIAIVQAIGYEMPAPPRNLDARPERVAVQRAWLKAEAAEGATRSGENVEARDSLVYAVTVDDAAALFGAVAERRRLLIGLRAWGRRSETVYVGDVELADEHRQSLATCLEALVH